MAKVIIPTPLRKFTNNESTLNTGGKTIQDAIEDVARQYPNLQKHLLDDEGNIRSFVRIFLGDDDILSLEKEQTPISEDSVVSIIPAIAGGVA